MTSGISVRNLPLARTAAFAAALGLIGCAVPTDPLTPQERAVRASADHIALFSANALDPLPARLTLSDVLARAIKHNLESRLRAMDSAVALGMAELSSFELLPQVTASAGYTGRNNSAGSTSLSVATGLQSLEPSTSQERRRQTANLGMVWNVLDFGVSYLRARQQSDRVLIAEERRRKAIHTILQQGRLAFWRAVIAERLQTELTPLMERVRSALATSRKIEDQGVQAPARMLDYQKGLLDLQNQLQQLSKDLVSAKVELAALMNLPPGQNFSLVAPERSPLPDLPSNLENLERLALVSRPELREEDYQARINADDTRKAILRLLPGLEFNISGSFDSNRFLVNNVWAEAGLRLTWNLMNLLSGPTAVRQAESQEQIGEMRRHALHMTVLTQVRIGWLRLREARDDVASAEDVARVDDKLHQIAVAAERARTGNELETIRREAGRLISRIRRDLAIAEAQNAAAGLQVSLGVDPLPENMSTDNLVAVSGQLNAALALWDKGRFDFSDIAPPPVRQAEAPPNAPKPLVAKPEDAPTPITPKVAEAPPAAAPPPAEAPPPADIAATVNAAIANAAAPSSGAAAPSSGDAPAEQPPAEDRSAQPAAPTLVAAAAPPPAPDAVPPPAGSILVQLASFKSADKAQDHWNEMIQDHPNLLETTPVIRKVTLPDGRDMFRLYADGNEQKLRSVCRSLKRQATDCILQNRDTLKPVR